MKYEVMRISELKVELRFAAGSLRVYSENADKAMTKSLDLFAECVQSSLAFAFTYN